MNDQVQLDLFNDPLQLHNSPSLGLCSKINLSSRISNRINLNSIINLSNRINLNSKIRRINHKRKGCKSSGTTSCLMQSLDQLNQQITSTLSFAQDVLHITDWFCQRLMQLLVRFVDCANSCHRISLLKVWVPK